MIVMLIPLLVLVFYWWMVANDGREGFVLSIDEHRNCFSNNYYDTIYKVYNPVNWCRFIPYMCWVGYSICDNSYCDL